MDLSNSPRSLSRRSQSSRVLILFALLCGFGLSWTSLSVSRLFDTLVVGPEPLPLCQASERQLSEALEDRGAQFVQEPANRSSFRPDFSSGLRRAHQRNNFTMLRAFSEAVVDARLSTVQLLDEDGRQIALGAIIDPDGWIATKASQLSAAEKVTAQLSDNTELVAEIVQRSNEYDIALLRIQRGGLHAVHWADSSIPLRGTWLATTDIAKMPTAVGVVSAGIQSVHAVKARLGVELVDSATGAAVVRVLMGTGADYAGLRVGDNIIAVNGISVASQPAFQRAIDASHGGTVVKLTVTRGEKEFETNAQLMDLADELLDETEMEVNGPVSARATGFNRVFLHDTVLDPTQCGGPLCNLNGQVVGLNIARAGRVSSYALPVDVLQPLLQGMIAQATLVSRPITPPVAGSVR